MHRFQAFVLSLFAAIIISAPGFVHAQERESLPEPVVVPTDSGAYGAVNRLPTSLRGSAPFAREFYNFARHAGSAGVVDNNAYIQTFEEARGDMLRESERSLKSTSTPQSILSNGWTNIGLTGSDTVRSAGITRAITFDPQNPSIMYAGGNGGVWKSMDTGADWFELTDNWLPNLSVNTIAIDPVSPDTLYAGTGNCEFGIPPYNGSGLYRSTDGGASFEQLNALSGQDFVKVVVDPSAHNIVVTSSYPSGPVSRSTDYGMTWKPVTTISGFAWDIIATPAPNSTFYASTTVGIYKSIDNGATWTKTTNSSNYLPNNIGRSALASPAKAPNKVFVLVTDGSTGATAYLYLTTDGGATWNPQSVPSDLFALPGTPARYQGWYDLYLGVAPNADATDALHDTVYVGGVSAYVKSGTDGWSAFSDYGAFSHNSGSGGYTHVDHHSFAISPVNSNIVYDGDDGGLYVNYNAGSTDIATGGWILHSNNMVTNRFYHINLEPHNNKITWAGAQDQGLWELQQGTAPVTYSPADNLGDALQPLASVQSPSTVYGEGPEGVITKGISSNWSSVQPAGGWPDAVAWDAPFQMSPTAEITQTAIIPSSSILYVGRQYLWQSKDGGNTWLKLNPSKAFGSTGDGVYYCSAIGLPNWNANLIYAAGGGNNFWASTDFGVNWVSRTFPASGGTVTSIRTNYQNPGMIVVSLESSAKKVMMSNDSGRTWTDVSGVSGASLPGADVNTACNVMCLAIDSLDPLHTWYAGTDFGMYMTNDAGQHWSFIGPGLVPCRDVQIGANKTTMRLATFGRGIWEASVPSAVELTSLSVVKEPQGEALSWYVNGEPSGAQFFVQRSVDANAFQNIGSVAGEGASAGQHNYSFTDYTTEPGSYLYRVHEVNADGSEQYTNQVELHVGSVGMYCSQPYPNPLVLNGAQPGSVQLEYELPTLDNVLVRIYSIDGALVRTLLDHVEVGGPHTLAWNARDASGNLVAPGAYLCSIQTTQSGTVTQKVMVVGE